MGAYGRLTAAELSDLALQLEDIRQKLARGGVGYSSSDGLSVQVLVVEELAAQRALKELRDRQQVEKANSQREQAREEAQGQAVQEQRGIFTPTPGAAGTVTFNGDALNDFADGMAF